MKLHLYISNPEDFAKGELDWAFTIRTDKNWTDSYQPNWIYVKAIEVKLDKINKGNIIVAATEELEQCIQSTLARAEATAQGYRDRIQNLLALEAPNA